MTGLFLAAGIATLVGLIATTTPTRGHEAWLRVGVRLLPAVTVACAAATAASLIPATGAPPAWVSSLGPLSAAALFLLAVSRYRLPGRSTSRRRR